MPRVFITGGAGFLGRGFLRRFHDNDEWDITVFSRDETKQDEARSRYPKAQYVLGDVRDGTRLMRAMLGHDIIIHAAALKYIPEAELNAAECVSVNIDGARNIIEAAKYVEAQCVIGVSTDKACQPVNVYGASKMVMERLFADEAVSNARNRKEDGTHFKCVRYGNVIGSTGSVIPLFQKQYAQNGRVRITDPNMTRFWMSIDEAIDLILVSIKEASNGSVLIPPVAAATIVDVARAATVDDVDVEVIGQRPGEKLHEALIHHEESVRTRPLAGGYTELLPPGTVEADEAFTLASHTPHKRLSVVDMRRLIEDAKAI